MLCSSRVSDAPRISSSTPTPRFAHEQHGLDDRLGALALSRCASRARCGRRHVAAIRRLRQVASMSMPWPIGITLSDGGGEFLARDTLDDLVRAALFDGAATALARLPVRELQDDRQHRRVEAARMTARRPGSCGRSGRSGCRRMRDDAPTRSAEAAPGTERRSTDRRRSRSCRAAHRGWRAERLRRSPRRPCSAMLPHHHRRRSETPDARRSICWVMKIDPAHAVNSSRNDR